MSLVLWLFPFSTCSERLLKRVQLFASWRDLSREKVLVSGKMALIPPNNYQGVMLTQNNATQLHLGNILNEV